MKVKNAIFGILWVSISILIALLSGEIIIRRIKPAYDHTDRALMFSSPTFKQYANGSVRYYPNERIREVAVYNNKIEYDVTYHTNNMGFVDSKDYKYEFIPGKKYYAFVGDSFTAGVNGGTPWVPKLRERINDPHIEIYNLGVTGTSFEHFYRLLKDMKHEIKVTDIVILAISDDITRTLWHPFITNNRINFCFQTAAHSTCSDDINAARIIPYNSSNDEIIRLSREVMKERNYRLKVELDFSSYLLSRSHLLYHLRSITDPHIHAINPDYVNGLMDTLRNIQAEFPFIPIKVIHLPEKYEVKTHRYRIVDLGKALEGIGVEYYPALGKCSWSDDMFFQMDAHPNAKGYDAISNCVSSYLFGR